MGSAHKLKSAWLFLLGVAIVLAGLYIYFDATFGMEYSFATMTFGLLFTGVGSVYGKKRLRNPAFYEEKPKEPPAPKAETIAKEITDKEDAKIKKIIQKAESTETAKDVKSQEPVKEDKIAVESPQMVTQQPETSQDAEVTGKIVKIYLCTKCGTENEERNTYCYECGKKLKTKKAMRNKK